jgi:cell division protein FtsB
VDKEIAVRTAEEAAADTATIASLEAEIEELKRRQIVTTIANNNLKSKIETANQETIKAQKEIMKYVENGNQIDRPTVSRELFSRMRSHK